AEKNIPLTLEAWKASCAKYPDVKMVVVGDGPVRRKLEKKWPEVHFAGMRYDEDLAAHYASADIFLFASESETFGNVVVEALASGLVTLTYDYAAGRQFIRSGENGFLAPLGDEKALVSTLEGILEQRGPWGKIRRAARKTAESYPWSDTIRRFSQLLQQAAPLEQKTPQIDIVSGLSNPKL
ncbi:MAG TPA: glycosyltransferase, partial [Opitutales bacterium]|nr:glycosyltransferase [Opitutales bacterium]